MSGEKLILSLVKTSYYLRWKLHIVRFIKCDLVTTSCPLPSLLFVQSIVEFIKFSNEIVFSFFILSMVKTSYYVWWKLHIVYGENFMLCLLKTSYYLWWKLHIIPGENFMLSLVTTSYYLWWKLIMFYFQDSYFQP